MNQKVQNRSRRRSKILTRQRRAALDNQHIGPYPQNCQPENSTFWRRQQTGLKDGETPHTSRVPGTPLLQSSFAFAGPRVERILGGSAVRLK